MSLPPLPQRNTPWSSNVHQANSLLCELYRRPTALLSSGNYNLHRVELNIESVLENAIPLLLEVEEAAEDEGIPLRWIEDVADHFARLLVELESAKGTTSER